MRILLLFVLIVGLWGCVSSPRYQTVYRYEPPTDAAGQNCLAQCEQQLGQCQSGCRQVYQACLKTVESLVEERYAEALKRYEAGLENYRWELERYQLQLWLSWNRGALGYDSWPYHPWPEPYYFLPPLPKKPSRAEELARLQQEKCEADCGCQPKYDACFLTCGGKKIPEQRCISDCPQSK